MKKTFTLLAAAIASLSLHAQNYCGSARYDSEVYSNITTTSDVIYGSNTSVNGQQTSLVMDIYEPANDTASIRPLIIFAHGGSFLGGTKTDADVLALCTHFAKRGYVTASISYRLGMGFPINAAGAKKAVWRATQDMKAAVRFFRQDAATNNTYKIDPNTIFVGGSSAGAFMSLHLAYLDQPSEIPSEIDTTQLGGLEGSSGNPGYPSTVKAIVNLCGALGDADFMKPGDVPLVSMHGTDDNTVPYGTAMLYIGGTYQIMVVDGSRSISAHADSIGIPNKFYTWYGQDHVPYYGTSAAALAYMDTTVRFVSNFLYTQLGSACTPADPNPLPNAPGAVGVITITDPDANASFIYPNPATGMFTIYRKGHAMDNITVKLTDVAGRTVKEMQLSGSESIDVSTYGISAGTYMMTITSDGKQQVKKVMIY
jgi:para-nitrobenzyl esterase